MQSLKENIHIEDRYVGVTLGAINLPRGIIYVDAPPVPEDGRAWRADLLELDSGYERMLISLDTNIDRSLGTRAMDCTVLAHDNVAEFFRSRPSVFKAQGQSTGAVWESIPNLSNVRWALPEISFTSQITLYWGETPITLEHHAGSDKGAIWLILPEEKVVFIGDAVLKNQPPFFSNADIPRWLEDLDLLASEKYQGYTIVSGRGGVCALITIEKQRDIIEKAYQHLEALDAKNAPVEETEEIIPELLSPLRFLASERNAFAQRLRYGLKEYYLRHYVAPKKIIESK